MMDIYGKVGKLDETLRVFDLTGRTNVVSYNIMIKTLGDQDRAEQALALLEELLHNDSVVKPNIKTFNSVIDALANSTLPNKLDKAYEILRLMETDKIRNMGVRADVITYTAVMKCAARSGLVEAGQRAEDLLHEMAKKSIKANEHTFTLAIEACMACGDFVLADCILSEMDKTTTPPTVVTYNSILNHWARVGSREAAERAAELVKSMKEMDDFAKPDVVSYTILIKAWSLSGSRDDCDKMWEVVQEMQKEGIELNVFGYTNLISVFSQTRNEKWVSRAEQLLRRMELTTDSQPEEYHYGMVVEGWKSMGRLQIAMRVGMPKRYKRD